MQQENQPSTSQLDSLEHTLEAFQENARQLQVMVEDVQPGSRDVLNLKLQTLISGLQELDQVRHCMQNVKVPVELLDYIDQGNNPQLFTKQTIDRTMEKNKLVNGKVEIYSKFRAHLLKELGEEMPQVVTQYRVMRDLEQPATQNNN